MTMTGRAAWAGWLVIATGLLAGPVSGRELVVAVPARPNMVQLGMDITHLRGGSLVSYQRAPDTGELVLHRWDRRARGWRDMPLDRFRGSAAGMLYLIGLDNELPPGLTAAASDAAAHVERIPTLLPAEAVNQFNRTLQFNRREWRLLADRYNLEIVDRNEARRRWGRFGPPAGHAPRAVPARPAAGAPDEPLSPMTVPDRERAVEPAPRAVVPAPAARPAPPPAAAVPVKGAPVAEPERVPEPELDLPEAPPSAERPAKGAPAPAPLDPHPADK